MVNIFVDDQRECPEGFMLARTFEDAQALLLSNKGNIEYLSLDNDLGQGFGKDGMDLFEFMQNNGVFPVHLNCHTSSFPMMMAKVAKDYMPKETIVTADYYEKIADIKKR